MSQANQVMTNAFIGKPEMPTDADLSAELGRPAKALWDRLLAELAEQHHLSVREWNSYSRKAGWSLWLKRGARNILYLIPCQGCFRVSFVLGAAALESARSSGLPDWVVQVIDTAKRYVEGTGVQIDIHSPADFAVVLKLTAAKLAH